MTPTESHYRPTKTTGVKVPHVAAAFWAVKFLTTGMGEAMSDAIAGLPAILALLLLTALFALFVMMFLRQLRARQYHPVRYWLVVALIAVFGTMAADVVHVVVGNTVTTVVYMLAVAGVLFTWHKVEGSISIHSITTRRRELFYWATVAATFALGTAAGDFAADTIHLGYRDAALTFATLMVLLIAGWRLLRWPSVPVFWVAYMLTRPVGASLADWFGKPAPKGLAWGDGTVASLCLIVFMATLVWLTRSRADTPA